MLVKAIETVYKGYRFRSRLEARWAVFFDALEIPWDYELEGFALGGLGWYLPDFWLPRSKWFVEVKPVPLSENEQIRCNLLDDYPPEYAMGCFPLIGTPEMPVWHMQEDYGIAHLVGWSGNTAFLLLWEGPSTNEAVQAAVNAARQARWEHGESP